jgi:hypothetical protein
MSAMVKDIIVKFDKYWLECSPILACAAVLDPRYKLNLIRYCFNKVYGKADSIQHIDRVVALLHRLLAEYKKSSCSSLAGTNVVEYHAKDDLFGDYTPRANISVGLVFGITSDGSKHRSRYPGVLEWYVQVLS